MVKNKDIIEEIAEAPSKILESAIEAKNMIGDTISNSHIVKKSKRYADTLGPGLVTGAADDDPSGIATYSQAGAQFGYKFLWLSLLTFPLMAVAQEMCARIALVTGRGLAANIKRTFSKKMLYFCTMLLLIANTINIGADLGAMAKAIQLIVPRLNFALLVILIGLTTLVLQVFIPYKKYVQYLKWLTITLFAYVITGLIVKMNWVEIFKHALTPSLSFTKKEMLLVVGILGTTISPYLFFWQTSQEVEEQIMQGKNTIKKREGTNKQEINVMRADVWSGMLFSNLVMFFIIAVCATTLYSNGITNIDTASDAALALRPLAGDFAYILFSLGIIGTGMLAIPVLAGSTSYAISESFGWKEGLYRKLKEARAFYGVIIISILIGIALNFLGIHPIKALIYAAIVNGLIAPVILFCIVTISSDKKIMGEFANSKINNFFGWLVTLVMFIASVATIFFIL